MKASLLILHAPEEEKLAKALVETLTASLPQGHIESLSALSEPKADKVEKAGTLLLLLSEAFLSDEIQHSELLDMALGRATEDDFLLIPILADVCEWEDSPYSGLKVMPQEKVPLSEKLFWGGSDKALTALQKELNTLLSDWQLQHEEPEAYAKAVAAAKKAEPSFRILAARLIWRSAPQKLKWGLAALMLVLLAVILYFLLWFLLR